MATTNITPNAGGAPSGDAGGTPNATPSSAAAQPQHSGDRALANFQGTDPNKGGIAVPAAAAPGAPAAAVPDPAAVASGDVPLADLAGNLATLLGDDLTATVDPAAPAAAAVADPNADPLEALKDNPRVMELVAAETSLKGLLTKSEYVKEVAHIGEAIADAEVLWQIVDGKADVGSILDAAKNQSPQAFPKILDSLRAYLLKETGVPVAAAAAGHIDPANMTEDQKRIVALEKEASDRKAADLKTKQDSERATIVKRMNDTKATIMTKLPDLLKDSIFEGEADHFFGLHGNLLRGKEQQIVDAVEKGDFKLIETAVKQARSQEAVRFKARIDRAIELQKKKIATIPKQGTGGAPGAGNEPGVVKPASSKEERLKNMASALKTA